DSMFSHLAADGYNLTHKYQSVSNGGAFRSLYVYFFGLRQKMNVEFIDHDGVLKRTQVEAYNPEADTPRVSLPQPKLSRKEKRERAKKQQRNLTIDTSLQTAFLEVH